MYWMFSNVLFYFCSILSAEFIRSSLTDAAESDVIILSKAKSRASLLMNGKDDEVRSYLKLLLSLTPLFVLSLLFYMNLVLEICQLFTIIMLYRGYCHRDFFM
jgi:hypothetical protein